MSTVVLSTSRTPGDRLPFVAPGMALQGRGHRVRPAINGAMPRCAIGLSPALARRGKPLTPQGNVEENALIPTKGAIMTEERVQESRRRLLKIIAATGGAVAASTVLPGTWLKPVVEMGVLPAHAQLSDRAVEIFNLAVECQGCAEAGSGDAGASALYLGGWFDWQALCDLCNSDSYLTVESTQCGTLIDKKKLNNGWWSSTKKKSKDQKGNVFYGSANFCSSDYCSWGGLNETDTIRAWIDHCGDRSNVDDVTITKISNASGS